MRKTKPAIQCLAELPYKIQVQILKNWANQGRKISECLLSEFYNAGHLISGAFDWEYTSEGTAYWVKISSEYRK